MHVGLTMVDKQTSAKMVVTCEFAVETFFSLLAAVTHGKWLKGEERERPLPASDAFFHVHETRHCDSNMLK